MTVEKPIAIELMKREKGEEGWTQGKEPRAVASSQMSKKGRERGPSP